MSEAVFVELLSLTSGIVLLTAVLVLWHRELAMVIRVFTVQGVALAGLVTVLAVHEAIVLGELVGHPERDRDRVVGQRLDGGHPERVELRLGHVFSTAP